MRRKLFDDVSHANLRGLLARQFLFAPQRFFIPSADSVEEISAGNVKPSFPLRREIQFDLTTNSYRRKSNKFCASELDGDF